MRWNFIESTVWEVEIYIYTSNGGNSMCILKGNSKRKYTFFRDLSKPLKYYKLFNIKFSLFNLFGFTFEMSWMFSFFFPYQKSRV